MNEVVTLMTSALRQEDKGELLDATGHVNESHDKDAHT